MGIYGFDKTENLLVNGDFANELDGWETMISSTPQYSKIWVENGKCHFAAGASNASSYYKCQIYQILRLQPSKYNCSFDFTGSLSYWGGSKVFYILASDDEEFDTSWGTTDEILVRDAKNYDEEFASEYSYTLNKESYIMVSWSVDACYANTVISNCKITRDTAFIDIQAKSYQREYGDINPAFEVICNGIVPGDEALLADNLHVDVECDATEHSNVGEYPITLNLTGNVSGYVINQCKNGTLSINKALVNVSCNDMERSYGEPNPIPDIIYNGFKNGEDQSILTATASYRLDATTISDTGEYPIEIYGAEALNYDFNYNNGILRITKADQSIEWNQTFENIHIGDQIELLATTDSGLPIEYLSSGNVEVYKSGDRSFIDCQGKGDVIIRALQEGNNNYNAAVRVVKSFTILDDATGCDDIAYNGKPSIYTEGGYLINDTPTQEYLEVTDIAGHCRYRGKDKKVYLGSGLYIVRVNSHIYKLICR